MNPPDIMPTAVNLKSANYKVAILNTTGIPSPVPILQITNYSALGYADPVTFAFSINVSNIYPNTSQGDPNGVMCFSSVASGLLSVYPKAMVSSPNNYFYLTNGISQPTLQVAYSPVTDAYCPNGRPFFVSNIVNGGNIMVCLPVSITSSGGIATMSFNFPAINWGGSTICNYSINLQLLNKGNLASESDVTTTNFIENM